MPNLLIYASETRQAIFTCQEVITGNAKMFALQNALNFHKDTFKNTVDLMMHRAGLKIAKMWDFSVAAGYPRIKLMHVYCHVKGIDFYPCWIAFGGTKRSSHQVILTKEARKLLGQRGNIAIQLKQV
jgi:hypothetical protein